MRSMTIIFSRVQRDSISHFVGPSVGLSVCRSVCPAFAFLAVLSILSHFKSIKKIEKIAKIIKIKEITKIIKIIKKKIINKELRKLQNLKN